MVVKLAKRGEFGFSMIELLIVVAILGALAAVAMVAVSRFTGSGEPEAAATELKNVQSAVTAMMVDNLLSSLPNPVGEANATNDMGAFPDTSLCQVNKLTDPDGKIYAFFADKNGYFLFQHDIDADGTSSNLINYIDMRYSKGTYYVNSNGAVSQKTTGYD
ncbi:type II secretion system protein [Chloroflexota bacterium]